LRVDGRWTEDGAGFVDFREVGAGILEIWKYEQICVKERGKKDEEKGYTR
jgi:hypothetical protein